ncbi:MAG TPA: glycoside hydrolase family 2 [Chloroflexota bacterium]|nr:glycoside hydrolase family 2 [Chloroflexota bacterium]
MADAEFGLTRERDEAAPLEPFLNPLPRSVSRSGAFLLLDGEWRFALDLDGRGLGEKWYLGHEFPGTANWPGSIEAQMEAAGHEQEAAREAQASAGGAGGRRLPWQDEVVAWYERDFEVPSRWIEAPDSMVQVTFGACGYETRAWLNGMALHTVEGEEVHLGEWTSFSFELPPEYLRPVNRLTVRVADSLDPDTPRGKQESHVYKRGGIWYQTISGPVRSIWIEPVERNRLRSRLSVVSTLGGGADRLAEFRFTTRVHDPGLYRLRLVVSARGAGEPLATKEVDLRLEAGEQRQHLALELPEAEPWAPGSPALYQVVAQLGCPDGHVSQIEASFGLRQIEARGRWITLNDQRLYLDGILYQPGTATFEEMRRHMRAMKALGCNLVRVHIAGIDPRIYQLADELGILLWVEVPSPHQSSSRSREKHWNELRRLLVHLGSHPSVVLLSLYNEDWGAQDIATNPETRAYVARAVAHLRQHEPQLLVVDNDGWQHVSAEGRLQSHLLTVHLYKTEVEAWREALDRLVAGEHEGVAALPLVVGDPYFYGGQAPIVVSEWGGFGFAMYGGPEEPGARAERIRAFKRELRRRPLAGDVYTQATSIEGESNGLLDPHTGELFLPRGLLASSQRDA